MDAGQTAKGAGQPMGSSRTLPAMPASERDPMPAKTAAACALAALVLLGNGCASGRSDAAGVTPTQPTPSTDGVAAPVPEPMPAGPVAAHTASAIDVSDLSRVERDLRRRPLIELRIDAVDAAGAPARLGGSMRVVVAAAGAEPPSQTFDLSLRSQAEADKRYDAILRQYVLRVEPSWKSEPARGSTVEVRATLTLASGSSLEASGSIEW